jgi:hypothetical protein
MDDKAPQELCGKMWKEANEWDWKLCLGSIIVAAGPSTMNGQ